MDPSQNNYYSNGENLNNKNDNEASNRYNAEYNPNFENKNSSQGIFMI
jgi:hypothetical protein